MGAGSPPSTDYRLLLPLIALDLDISQSLAPPSICEHLLQPSLRLYQVPLGGTYQLHPLVEETQGSFQFELLTLELSDDLLQAIECHP